MRIFNSRLEARLKPLASLCALYGDEHGEGIFPSVERLAWGLGITKRAVQMQLARLRSLQVLIPVTPLTGGARRSTQYRLQISEALERPVFKPQGRTLVQGLDWKRDEASFIVPPSKGEPTCAEPRKWEHGTTNAGSPNHEPAFARSSSDRTEDLPMRKAVPASRDEFLRMVEQANPKFAAEQRDLQSGGAADDDDDADCDRY